MILISLLIVATFCSRRRSCVVSSFTWRSERLRSLAVERMLLSSSWISLFSRSRCFFSSALLWPIAQGAASSNKIAHKKALITLTRMCLSKINRAYPGFIVCESNKSRSKHHILLSATLSSLHFFKPRRNGKRHVYVFIKHHAVVCHINLQIETIGLHGQLQHLRKRAPRRGAIFV